MPQPNSLAVSVPASGIRRMMQLAADRPGAIRLDIGDPDFPTPAHVVEAAHRAAQDGHTHYQPSAGLRDLREALAGKLRSVNGNAAEADRVIVTQGATQALHLALAVTARPGDEVLLPDPGWPNYGMMAALLGLRVRCYGLANTADHLPSVDELESLITPRTRVLVLNSPSNPLGITIPADRVRELVALAERHDLWLVSDECYDQLTFGEPPLSPAVLAADRTIATYSFSKTYAMTGWRVGYAVVPQGLAHTYARCQEATLACVNGPAQFAALAALVGPQDCVDHMREAYRLRRDAAVAEAAAVGLSMPFPTGACYGWLDIGPSALGAEEFADRLLGEHGICVTPGTAFGALGAERIRLALTAEAHHLRAGIRAIAAVADRTLVRLE